MELNQSRMPSGLPLVHLHPASGVEQGGTSETPASIRDRLSPTREGKLWWRVCLHPHLEQGRMLPVEKSHGCGCCFFLSYRWELAVPGTLLLFFFMYLINYYICNITEKMDYIHSQSEILDNIKIG